MRECERGRRKKREGKETQAEREETEIEKEIETFEDKGEKSWKKGDYFASITLITASFCAILCGVSFAYSLTLTTILRLDRGRQSPIALSTNGLILKTFRSFEFHSFA